MPRDSDTAMGGGGGRFPTTHWTQIAAVRGEITAEQGQALNFLIRRYWRPVYQYLRRRGFRNEDAKDLVQEFFTSCLSKEFLGRADPTRGRFRAFLLACLDRFVSNVRRAAHAQRRCPAAGIVSLDDLGTDEDLRYEPADHETPEAVFERRWAHDLIQETLRALEQECRATGKEAHFELFRLRIIEPALHGVSPPPLRELAGKLRLTEKGAANHLLTARRAYQRLLREEIRLYASSEQEIAAEVRDLFLLLAEK